MEELEFKIKRAEVRVILESEEGEKTAYLLRELTGKQRDDYQKTVAKQIKPDKEGVPTNLAGMAGLRSQLLILSIVKEQGLESVSLDVVDGLPASVHESLYLKCVELSGLGAEGELGND